MDVERYGSYFEKTAMKMFCVILHIYLRNGGVELARLPELFHDNKLDDGVASAGVP